MIIDDVMNALIASVAPFAMRVYRGYPPSFAIYPVVGVYILNESDFVTGDGTGLQVFKDFINIDVWTKDQIDDIKTKVISSLYSLSGFIRQNAFREISEGEGIIHLTFEYEIIA
jgi:hypothetical protein